MTPEQIAAKYAASVEDTILVVDSLVPPGHLIYKGVNKDAVAKLMLAFAAEIVAQSQVVAGMEEAIRTIEAWHGTGEIWGLYQHSPEMKRINAALASLRALANRSETAPR